MNEGLNKDGPAARPERSRSGTRIEHEAGFVLHSYAWRETSLILEVFTRGHGRLALVARGAKRPTSQFRGLLSPFSPVWLSWSGKSEIKSLMRVEWGGGLAPLRGEGLLAAFYLNELLVRLLARGDPNEALFSAYVRALHALASGSRASEVLRAFEVDLLRDIGWLPALDHCTEGAPIEARAWYRFDQTAGLQRVNGSDEGEQSEAAPDELCVHGATVSAMARRDFSEARAAGESKTLLRRLIRYHLNGKPLNTRRILQDLKEL